MLPFLTSVLSPKDYGIVALISLVSIIMSGVLTLGTGNSLVVLYYKEEELSKRPSIIWSNFSLLVINGIFWYSVIWLVAPSLSFLIFQTNEYQNLIRISFLGSVLTTVADPWMAFLRMNEKAKKYLLLTLAAMFFNIVLSIYFVLIIGWGIKGLLLAGTMSASIMVIVIWFFVGRKISFHLNPKLFLPLVRIGFPSIFGLFAFFIIDYADRQMIERILSLSDLGVFSVGYSFGLAMLVAVSAFGTAWPPFFISYVKKPNEAREVFGRVLTYYIIAFGSLSVLFFFVAKPILILMTAPSFHDAWKIVGIVATGYMFKGCYLILVPGVYFAEKLVYQSIIEWIAAILNIGFNLWLIPLFGILGAAYATFISYFSLPFLAWFVSRGYLKVDYEWSRVLSISIIIFITCLSLYQISEYFSSDIFNTMLYATIVFCAYLVITFKISLNKKERDIILNKIGFAK